MQQDSKTQKTFAALADICKKQGVAVITATQPIDPNRRPRFDIAEGGPIFIDYMSKMGK